MSGSYQVLTFYNAFCDAECKRVSMFNERGDEFWTVVEKPGAGRVWRTAREQAIAKLLAAIDADEQPGER